MAKIARKNQKIFANDISVGQFGSYAEGSGAYSSDVETIQALNAYDAGLGAALINNAPPAIEDIDGLIYMMTKQLAYIFQAGIPEYNASTTYYIGSLVSVAGQIFMSITDGNVGNNVSNVSHWIIYKTNNVTRYTGSIAQASYSDYIVELNGSTAGGANPLLFILPTPTNGQKGRIIVVKNLYPTASGSVQIQVEDSSTIDGSSSVSISTQYDKKRFICNGTKWEVIT
jgi:hypothetical protein